MSTDERISVFSEIGPLKTVLLHRPGVEVENLTPSLLSKLLFDDIPYLVEAQKEHKVFSDMLEAKGVKVLYIEGLLKETLHSEHIKKEFLDQFFKEANIASQHLHEALMDHFLKMPLQDMVNSIIGGLRQEELKHYKRDTLADLVNDQYPFILDPMPNLLFTRDPFSTIGHGISLHTMHTDVRRRETIFAEYILKHHPIYSKGNMLGHGIPLWYDRHQSHSIEGGDILILSKDTIAIGISERTEAAAIEILARNIFSNPHNTFKRIVGIELESKRAFMHLDTVLTQLDHDKFAIHAEIKGPMRIFVLTPDKGEYGLKVEQINDKIENVLGKYLGTSVKLIPCGNGNLLDSQREQWNDGANTLAVAPGEVFVYARNHVTNELLDKNGIKLHIVPSAELSRGRGGPRCMSMPFIREMI